MRFTKTLRNGFISLCLATLILLIKANYKYFVFRETTDHIERSFHQEAWRLKAKEQRKLKSATTTTRSTGDNGTRTTNIAVVESIFNNKRTQSKPKKAMSQANRERPLAIGATHQDTADKGDLLLKSAEIIPTLSLTLKALNTSWISATRKKEGTSERTDEVQSTPNTGNVVVSSSTLKEEQEPRSDTSIKTTVKNGKLGTTPLSLAVVEPNGGQVKSSSTWEQNRKPVVDAAVVVMSTQHHGGGTTTTNATYANTVQNQVTTSDDLKTPQSPLNAAEKGSLIGKLLVSKSIEPNEKQLGKPTPDAHSDPNSRSEPNSLMEQSSAINKVVKTTGKLLDDSKKSAKSASETRQTTHDTKVGSKLSNSINSKPSGTKQQNETTKQEKTRSQQVLSPSNGTVVSTARSETAKPNTTVGPRDIQIGMEPTKKRSAELKSLVDDKAPTSNDATKPKHATKDKPLNILILYPDDWRHDTIGAAGTQPVLTPFLDSMANEGIRFTHNCVTTSICWVSRATLATGQYLARHKSESVKNPIFYKSWNETWQGILRDNGYYTGHIGKWQYYNYSFVQENHNFTRLYEGTHWVQTFGKPKIPASEACRNDTLEFLRGRPKDQPFALTVAFYPPKAIGAGPEQWFPKKEARMLYENITIPEPMDWNASYYNLPEFFRVKNEARTRWTQRFGNYTLYQNSMKNYYALITQVDEACKEIVDELKKQNVLDDTLVIFTTDNGFFHGEHGLAGKWFPYQESIRVPLIIRDPRMPKSKRGSLDDSFTLNIDLATTILGAAKLPVPSQMQGKDMSELYLSSSKGKHEWRKEFYYEHPSLGSKYIPASSALVRKDFKYMYYREYRLEQLFNLALDPLENEDLANRTEYAALVKEMREKHNEYIEIVK